MKERYDPTKFEKAPPREDKPKREVSDETARKLGKEAIRGTQRTQQKQRVAPELGRIAREGRNRPAAPPDRDH